MKERQSFVVYKEWRDVVDTMTAEQSKQFLQAMFAYQDGEDLDDIITDPSVKMVFTLVKKQFDRDMEKYNDMCQKRAESGKKGGNTRAVNQTKASKCLNEQANEAKASKCLNEQANEADNDNDNEDDNDNDLKEKAPKGAKKKSTTRFSAPTIDQVREYCRERGNKVDAENFVAFYESKGWMVGQNHMKDWKAAVRTWEQRDARGAPKVRSYQGKTNKFNNFEQREYDFDEYERRLLSQ